MPRERKCRRVCFEPQNKLFLAQSGVREFVMLTVEELEALRLADREGMEQSVAADHMEVSRGTFQRILYSARYKVAKALTQGHSIRIEGGHYQLDRKCIQCKGKCGQCARREQEKAENLD